MVILRASIDGRKSAFGMLHHGGVGGSGEQVSPLQNYVSLEVNSSWGGEKNESP